MRRITITGDVYTDRENENWFLVGPVFTLYQGETDEHPRILEPSEQARFGPYLRDATPVSEESHTLIRISSELYFETAVQDPDRILTPHPPNRPFILDGENNFEIVKPVKLALEDLDSMGEPAIPEQRALLVEPGSGWPILIDEDEVQAAVRDGRITECVPARIADRHRM